MTDSNSSSNRIADHVRDMPPSGIREFFELVQGRPDVISLGVGEPVLARYERIAFQKDLIALQGQPLAAFVCPGHPLLDAPLDLTLERHRDLLRRGTVLVDGVPRHSCLALARSCAGTRVETIEALADHSRLSRLQAAFNEKLGAQCGICTPGMVMAAEGLLRRHPDPSVDQIRDGLGANICRCTGYVKIIEAVQAVAR